MQEINTAAGPAHVVLDQPDGPARFLAVLTHGSGGTPDTADLLAVRDAARSLGAATALVTQPYVVRGGRAPGSAVKQDAAWIELVTQLRQVTGTALPLVQCGRSNGARVACRTARPLGAAGVIALAFPLHPPGHPERSRDAELRSASQSGASQSGASHSGASTSGARTKRAGASVLVVNGERDPFGVPEPDEATEVVVLPGETHALSKRPAAIGDAVSRWLSVVPGLASALGLPGPDSRC